MKNIKIFAFLAIFLLSAAVSSAWAVDVTLTYKIDVQGAILKPVAHIYNAATGEEVASWDHGLKTLWPANEGRTMNDDYKITFTPNRGLDKTGENENNKSTSTTAFRTEKTTLFTVSVGEEGFYFKSVTFKEDNTEKASSSNIAPNSTSIRVEVPENKFFNYITVVLTVDAYTVSVPENLTISDAFATISGVNYYKAGKTVTLTAKENEIINTITGVTASNENVTINLAADRKTATFKMPSEDVTITATTTEVHTVSVPDGITLSDAFINISGTDYYKKGQTVTFGFSGFGSVVYFVNGERIEGNSVTVGKKDLKVEIGIPYIDENGKEQIRKPGEYTVLTSLTDVSNLGGGWYVVQGKVKYSNQVKFSGDAHLILADGAEMVIKSKTDGILADKNLTIYGQNGQSGILNDTANGSGVFGIYSKGTVTINGGSVTASGFSSGIHSSEGVTINGGIVTATGNSYGIYNDFGNITINGGIVTATGKGGSGIYSWKSNVTISGGIVTATGFQGIYNDFGNITISGGSVTATGTNNGIYGSNGVTINGGIVTATCGYGYGIYSQNRDITLGWTNSTDFIKASNYKGSVQIAEGKSFKDDKDNVYSGTLTGEQLSAIKGKKLEPAKPFPDNMDIAHIPDQTYTGDSICPKAVLTMSAGVGSLVEGKDYKVVCKENLNAGTATLSVQGVGIYYGEIKKTFTIAKASLTVTAKNKTIAYGDEPANDGVEYDGFVGEENASVLGGELSYSYNYKKLDKVGEYTITPSGLTSGNYEITFAAGTLTVKKADVSVEALAAKEKLVYNGKAQELVTAGKTNFGTLLYSLDGEKYSAEIPTATDAKTYTVYYKVAESDNWNAFEAKTIEVVIAKAPLTVTAKDKSIVYGNEPANDGVEYSGFIGEENASVLGGELSYSYNYQKLDKVGEYTITPSGLTAGNYEITYAAGTLTVEIAAVSVEAPVAKEKLVYSGKSQELVTAGKTNFGTLLYSLDGEKYSAEIPTATDAKTYTVYYKVAESDNWNAFEAKKVEVKIAKAPLTITAKDKTIAYGDEPANDGVEYSGFIGEENESVLGGELTYSYNYQKLDKVGEYTITPSGLTASNYEISFVAGTLTVKKADISVEALAAKEKLVYNGKSQELVTAGKTNFGTLLYSLDGKKYSAEIPTATDAKTYTVYYKVEGSDNWNAFEAKKVEVVIAKAPLTVTAKDKSIVYGNEPANDGVEYSGFIGEENESVLGGELSYSYSYKKLDKAGEYTITPSGLTSGNYEITFAAGTLTVKKADVSVEALAAKEKLVYSGKSQELVTAGKTNFGTLLYSLDGKKYSSEIPAATDAKTYTVYYKVEGSDNWNAFEAKTIEVVIAKAPLTVTAKDKSIVYGNEPANDGVEYSGFIGDETASVLGGKLTYSYDYKKLDKAGEYTITPSGLTSGNYEITFAAGTLTVKKADVSVEAPVAKEKLVYSGKAQELVTAGKTNFGTLLYSLDGEKYSAEIPAATDAKTYTVYYKVEGSDNWNAFDAKKVEVKIAKADVSVEAPVAKEKLVYNGKAQELVTAGKTNFGKLLYSLDGEKYSAEIPAATDAKTYTVYYKVEGSDNWNAFEAKKIEVKIAKAAVSVEAPVAKEKLVYNGKAQELVTAGKTNFGKLLYSLDGEKYSAEIPAATDAKTYTVYYKVEGSDNWNAFEAKKIEVKIEKSSAIGRMSPRAARVTRAVDRSFDLKGRPVRGSSNARGAYYKK